MPLNSKGRRYKLSGCALRPVYGRALADRSRMSRKYRHSGIFWNRALARDDETRPMGRTSPRPRASGPGWPGVMRRVASCRDAPVQQIRRGRNRLPEFYRRRHARVRNALGAAAAALCLRPPGRLSGTSRGYNVICGTNAHLKPHQRLDTRRMLYIAFA